MIILEKPYVSAPLVAYLEEKQIPVLHNDMAEVLKQQGHSLNCRFRERLGVALCPTARVGAGEEGKDIEGQGRFPPHLPANLSRLLLQRG